MTTYSIRSADHIAQEQKQALTNPLNAIGNYATPEKDNETTLTGNAKASEAINNLMTAATTFTQIAHDLANDIEAIHQNYVEADNSGAH